jgi:hypothetical protein
MVIGDSVRADSCPLDHEIWGGSFPLLKRCVDFTAISGLGFLKGKDIPVP